MCSHRAEHGIIRGMIDFRIGEFLDDRLCLIWLERHQQADGFICPRCGGTERRLFRAQGQFPAYRCRACEGSYMRLTGTVLAKTWPRPATLVLRLRGIAIEGRPVWEESKSNSGARTLSTPSTIARMVRQG
jgi:predicted RNA-binding Zn-ribbon protein involved in translation (DUF1610 family)